MGRQEYPLQNLSKDDLVEILGYVPEDKLKPAFIFKRVSDSRKDDPQKLWEDEFRKLFKEVNRRDFYNDMPQQKIEWYLDAVDIIGRSLRFAPELHGREIEEIVDVSGLFDKKYVNPEVQRLYDKPSNWVHEKGYQDQIHSRYVGPNDLRRLVQDDSRFSRDDLRSLLSIMEDAGYIERGKEIFSHRLAKKE